MVGSSAKVMPPGQLVEAVGQWRWPRMFGPTYCRSGSPLSYRLQPVGEMPVFTDRPASSRSRLRCASTLGRRVE
jgi:hypothetical protein